MFLRFGPYVRLRPNRNLGCWIHSYRTWSPSLRGQEGIERSILILNPGMQPELKVTWWNQPNETSHQFISNRHRN
jgi:hypothetical protein